MFLFQISAYDDPALADEIAELLHQRLEAHSRQVMPALWKATDKLNTYTDREPKQEKRQVRYHICGFFLIALGIFVLIPGLVKPRTPALILAGGLAIMCGISNLFLANKKRVPQIPASCWKEAGMLLEKQRTVDWSKVVAKVCFDETGLTVSTGEKQELVPYDKISDVFEADHLWLVIYNKDVALLLQKKDLILGETTEFFSYLCSIVSKNS